MQVNRREDNGFQITLDRSEYRLVLRLIIEDLNEAQHEPYSGKDLKRVIIAEWLLKRGNKAPKKSNTFKWEYSEALAYYQTFSNHPKRDAIASALITELYRHFE